MSTVKTEANERAASVSPSDSHARERAQEDRPSGRNPPLGAQFEALYLSGSGLITALRRFLGALGALFGAEARVLRDGIPLFFIGTIALVALSVSLWACLVALIFWALRLATHSSGIALGIIVAGHIVLVIGLWFALKRGVRQASFPQARAEWRAMRHQLAEDFGRFAHYAHGKREDAGYESRKESTP